MDYVQYDGTTKEYGDNTDIPQEDIDDALILDYGRYTTISWHYQNKQELPHDYINNWYEACYDYYIKCITTVEAPAPVCIFYTQRYRTGYDYMDTYCDAYLENCRIGYRYWRLIGYGRCELNTYFWGEGKDYLIEM